MSYPAYNRSNSESTFNDATSDERDDSELYHAGLRRKKLCAMIACLVLLTVMALFVLVINLMILSALQISPSGMRFLKFHSVWNPKTNEKEKMVQFSGPVDLGSVVSMSGRVGGHPETDMNIQGSRVLIQGDHERGSKLILQENGCKFENAKHFQVISSKTGRPIFSAQHPLVSIDKRIRRLSTQKIITNKIRSPIDEPLSINVDNVSFRGNEAIRFEAHNITMKSAQSITFNTSADGSIHFHGKMILGGPHREFPISQSPALSASIDAFRVCVCGGAKPKVFLVPGNKPCLAPVEFC